MNFAEEIDDLSHEPQPLTDRALSGRNCSQITAYICALELRLARLEKALSELANR